MSENNQKPPKDEKPDFSRCRVRKISTDLIDCLADHDCDHALPFGNGRFCRHPLKHLIPGEQRP